MELPDVFLSENPTFSIPGIRPIFGVSENVFRGHKELSIASLLPETIEQLGLTRENPYSLNYSKENQQVVEFLQWQDAFDEERRRQKPISAGVSLRIKRETLATYLQAQKYSLHFYLKLRRTTDKYIPEEDMQWKQLELIY